MEAPPSAAVIPVDPVWRKKRSFWIWNIAISGLLMIIGPASVWIDPYLQMRMAFVRHRSGGASISELSAHINEVRTALIIGVLLFLSACIWMVMAIIRLSALHKSSPGPVP